jgi:hypothetical protein
MGLIDRAGRLISRLEAIRQSIRKAAGSNKSLIAQWKLVSRSPKYRGKEEEFRLILDRARISDRALIAQWEKTFRSPKYRGQEEEFRLLLESTRKARTAEPFLEEPSTAEPTITEVTPYHPEWQTVSSSNVEKMRWVGGSWGLQVGFRNGYLYEYAVAYTTYLEMLESSSKGRFVWWMRRSGVAYRRYNPTSIPPRIIYRWGHIGGPTDPSQYERPPQGVTRGPKQYRPAGMEKLT